MLVRLRDRPAPIQPESEALPVPFMIEKKTVVYDDHSDDFLIKGLVFAEDQPPGAGGGTQYFPGYTQKKRVERTITSSEAKHRVEVAPCIEDRLKMMKKYEEEKVKLLAKEAVMERKKKEQEEKLAALKAALETGDTSVMDRHEQNEEDLLLAGADGVELDESDLAELHKLQLELKEKKFTSKRLSARCHLPVGRVRRTLRAMSLAASGSAWKNNDCDQVLPWLYLGRGDVGQNCQFMEKMGFTHILNLTTTYSNAFPAKFVYKRIPIEDKTTEDASAHFRDIIDFIRRVPACRGKLYVHCTVGASRAPMAVMLYFVVVRKVSLLDIYTYLQAVRPVVHPNKHFLFQLSEIEWHQGLGSSVLHHKDWMHFEYNEMRAEDMQWRKPEGVYRTTLRVLSPENALLDAVDDLEAAIERKRAMFAAKVDKKKAKLRASHGGK